MLRITGGGKRARGSSEEPDIPTFFAKPEIKENDVEAVANALGKERFNIAEWLETLSAADLESLETTVDGCIVGGKIDSHINAYADFVGEIKDLQVPTLLVHADYVFDRPDRIFRSS